MLSVIYVILHPRAPTPSTLLSGMDLVSGVSPSDFQIHLEGYCGILSFKIPMFWGQVKLKLSGSPTGQFLRAFGSLSQAV